MSVPVVTATASRDITGLFVIAAGPDSLVGVTEVALSPTLTVEVDPIDPARLVRVTSIDEVSDADALLELLGPGIGAAIGQLEDEGDARLVLLEPPTQPVGRVGLLLWLQESSPLDLDEGLLAVDLAAAWSAVPGISAERQALASARRAIDPLLSLGRRLSDDRGGMPSVAAEVVANAADTALRLIPDLAQEVTTGLTTALAAARALTAAQLAVVGENLDWLLATLVPARAGDLATELGRPDERQERAFSVDWRMVPRGVLDIGEGTVVAQWGRQDPERVRVTVRGAASGRRTGSLMTQVLRGDSGERVASGLLDYGSNQVYEGTLTVPGGLLERDRVDVFSVLSTNAELRTIEEVNRAAGVRCASRGLTALRLAAAVDAPSGQRLWQASAAQWVQWRLSVDVFTPSPRTRVPDLDVATACWVRCLERLGESSSARRRAALVVDPARVPQWEAPAAAASIAELAAVGVIAVN